MDSIMSLIRSSLDGDAIAEIGDSLGEGFGKTHIAVRTALPVLVSALSRRATQDNGKALGNALDRDHNGEILYDVKSFFASGNFAEGSGIVGHVLGDKKPQAARAISNSTGMDPGKADTLLDMLAPVVLGAVGKVKQVRQYDSREMAELLESEERAIDKQLPGVISTVGVFLDRDGDGDGEAELTELMAHGRHLLNKIF